MKQAASFLIFSLFFIQILSEAEDFKEINDHFLLLNENLLNTSTYFIEEFERYITNLTSVIESVQSLSQEVKDLKDSVDLWKDLVKWPYYEDLKSCNDLKFRVASTFLLCNKYRLIEEDDLQIWWIFQYAHISVRRAYEKDPSVGEKYAGNFTEILDGIHEIVIIGRAFTFELRNFESPFAPEIQKLMNEKFKSCDCPTEVSSDSSFLEEYSKLFNASYAAEGSVSDLTVEFDVKLNETIPKVEDQNLAELLRSAETCIYEISVLYFLYKPVYRKDNFCLNLEMDLVNQDLIIWRKPKVIQEYKQIVFPCLDKCTKALQEKETSGKEKEMTEEIIKIMQNLENACKEFIIHLEENLEKYKEINGEMKKIEEEKCSCEKK